MAELKRTRDWKGSSPQVWHSSHLQAYIYLPGLLTSNKLDCLISWSTGVWSKLESSHQQSGETTSEVIEER